MNRDVNWRNAGIGLIGLLIVGAIILAIFYEIGQAPWQFITALIALFGTLITFASSLQIQIRNEQRPKKVEIYEKVIDFFFEIIFAGNLGHPKKTEAEVVEFFASITPQMILWASDEVFGSFIQFRQVTTEIQDADASAAILLFGKMLLAIRKDLGHQNNKLDERSILSAFVIDIQNLH